MKPERKLKGEIARLMLKIPVKFREPSKELLKYCILKGWDAYWIGFCDGVRKINQILNETRTTSRKIK